MNHMHDIKMHGATLQIGESTERLICPFCGGGSSQEKSFSVTRDTTGLLYNCFRAKCPSRGGFVGTTAAVLPPRRKKYKMRMYGGTVRPVHYGDIDYFVERFQLDPDLIELFIKVNDKDEYVLPVYTVQGLEQGYLIRQPRWKGTPAPPRPGQACMAQKSHLFPHAAKCMQSFYRPEQPVDHARHLIVVEDQISAIKCCTLGYNSVALLGTSVNTDKLREWSILNPQEVILALDQDATEESFRIARKYGLGFPRTRVAILDCDLKDMDLWDIPVALGVGNG